MLDEIRTLSFSRQRSTVAPMTSSPPATRSLRLLSCNILAGGSMSRYRDYITRSMHQVLPGSRKRDNLDGLAKLIGEFDLVGLQEADAGSFRSGFLNQTQYLAEAASFPYWSHQPNRRVSKLAASSNGLLARTKPDEVVDYPLPSRIPGRGALWTRFGEGDDSLIVVVAHLSLGAQARAKQMDFLAELLSNTPRAVLMGDLNTTHDSSELRRFHDRSGMVTPVAAPATFPSWAPRRAIDHILVSPDIVVEKLWTLPHPVSDHLPIAATIQIPVASRTTTD